MHTLYTFLLPALLVLPALRRLWQVERLRRLGLVSRRARGWLLAGLTAAPVLAWAAQAAVLRPADPRLPILGLAAAGLMLAAAWAAQSGVHPGLHGLQRALPGDGLALIAETAQPGRRRYPRDLPAWLLLLPALGLTLALALLLPEHRLRLGMLALLAPAPLAVIPARRLWPAPLLLLPPLALLLSQALQARALLPPGRWQATLSLARCTGPVLPAPSAGLAWCLDTADGTTYQFELSSGRVRLRQRVPDGARIFAANADYAWVQQLPARGLVRVGMAGMEHVPVLSAHSGAADSQNRLWVLDVGQELWRYDPDGAATRLLSRDGLLNNIAYVVAASPAGDVWAGSIGGVSWLPRGQSSWRRLERSPGLPGAVIDVAFGQQGETWLLWQAQPGYAARTDWGVSMLAADGVLQAFAVGAAVGLEAPRLEDALAVDARGAVWFVAQSLPQRQRWLGVFAPGSPLQIFDLGRFAASGPYNYGANGLWQLSAGVASDGGGGVLLYASDGRPWLRWRP